MAAMAAPFSRRTEPLSRMRLGSQQTTQSQFERKRRACAPPLGEFELELLHKAKKQQKMTGGVPSVLVYENIRPAPAPDASLAPKKALHIAVLKERFSRIISKAKRGTLYSPDSPSLSQNVDNTQQHTGLKLPRVADRVAARMALQEMEKTAQPVDEDIHFLKQLAVMCGSSEYAPPLFISGSLLGRPGKSLLERLGLFLKDEYVAVTVNDGDDECGIQAELKMERGRHREAARTALQRMEQTAEIEDNIHIMKELAVLSSCSEFGGPFFSSGVGTFYDARENPLKRLGLILKDESNILFNDELEDGEICKELEDGEICEELEDGEIT